MIKKRNLRATLFLRCIVLAVSAGTLVLVFMMSHSIHASLGMLIEMIVVVFSGMILDGGVIMWFVVAISLFINMVLLVTKIPDGQLTENTTCKLIDPQ